MEKNTKNSKNTARNNGKVDGNQIPELAFIGWLVCEILEDYLVRFIHCLTVLVPTLSFSPDREGCCTYHWADTYSNSQCQSQQFSAETRGGEGQNTALWTWEITISSGQNNRPEELIRDDV